MGPDAARFLKFQKSLFDDDMASSYSEGYEARIFWSLIIVLLG